MTTQTETRETLDGKPWNPNGWMGDMSRGAAMGQPARYAAEPDTSQKFSLGRVRLNMGGYDSSGTYWGLGPPGLYLAISEDGEAYFHLRAGSRDAAKAAVRQRYPRATFYR